MEHGVVPKMERLLPSLGTPNVDVWTHQGLHHRRGESITRQRLLWHAACISELHELPNFEQQPIRIYVCSFNPLGRKGPRISRSSALFRFHLERRPADVGICAELAYDTGGWV
jgi:hypothetical protein